MENFDFKDRSKVSVFFYYRVKAEKFIFSNILGNILFSFFIIAYVTRIFSFRKNFEKYMVLILELFNAILTISFALMYLKLSGFNNLECRRILQFYFYY